LKNISQAKINKAIFLDRDGVINLPIILDKAPYPPQDIYQLIIIPHIANTLLTLTKLGYLNIIVTNQPDVARGIQTKAKVERINNFLLGALSIDDIFVCYHDNKDNCSCRKPKAGMLLKAAKKYNIDFSKSWMIGDRTTDIEAGKKVGCKTIFIDYNYKETKSIKSDYIIKNVNNITNIVLGLKNCLQ